MFISKPLASKADGKLLRRGAFPREKRKKNTRQIKLAEECVEICSVHGGFIMKNQAAAFSNWCLLACHFMGIIIVHSLSKEGDDGEMKECIC